MNAYYYFLALMNAPAKDTSKFMCSWTAVILTPFLFINAVVLMHHIMIQFPKAGGMVGILMYGWAVTLFIIVTTALLAFVWGMLTNMEPLKLRTPDSVRRLVETYKARALQDSIDAQSQSEESRPR